ncbi:hypothetical protein HJFPF1_07100 [Paramyrothecium foliicola]|nr:hypothetical protein HJFPF1_07100 [Paramyrothecium foliicola]
MTTMASSKRNFVRIANCSGAAVDSAEHMYNQAKYGPVDVITGDYLAEANMAESVLRNDNRGWVPSAWLGLQMSLKLIHEKRIKVIINGGGLNPQGLAEKVQNLANERHLQLRVAFVDGDNLMHKVHTILSSQSPDAMPHLDGGNANVKLANDAFDFMQDPENMPIVAANAYLGYRAIKKGLDEGADIIICGRVSDASPVIAAAAWWHNWQETNYKALAGALVGGHLIECSTYVTGANFSGAYKRDVQDFVDPGLPIIEIDKHGDCVVTKHEALNGFVTADTVKCQLLYELQGNLYLNSDVAADISDIEIRDQGKNRVHVSGVRGSPPPPTTKLAVFYRGGYQCEILVNANGYATDHKWDIQKAQVRSTLEKWGALDKLDVLDFQRVGTPKENPDSQLASTTYMRIFAQAKREADVQKVTGAFNYNFMAHFAGVSHLIQVHDSLFTDRPFLGYFPAVIPQSIIDEAVTVIGPHGRRRIVIGPPKQTQAVPARANYETNSPVKVSKFGPTNMRPLGDIALGRSGDKGGNVNIGLFVQSREQWDWFRSFMTTEKLRELMGKDWQAWYFIERVEFPKIFAVHFVVYGPLGRGVSSSRLLDSLGKGFAEYIRAVHVPIPLSFIQPGSKL